MRRQWLTVASAMLVLHLVGCAAQDATAPASTTVAAVSTVTTTVPPSPTPAESTTTSTTEETAPCTTSSAPPTTSTTPPTPPTTSTTDGPDSLQIGDEGPLVAEVQERLTELGYWLGETDGVFGQSTHHAVVALQKAAGLPRDGIVEPMTRGAMAEGVVPVAASSAGHVVEIDLTRQLLLVVDEGVVVAVFDTSTGFHEGTTPVGRWSITREIDGLRESSLGLLYRPKYFYKGVAIHGYTSVPNAPASHGCVRVTYPAMDAIWELDLAPVGTPVWVY